MNLQDLTCQELVELVTQYLENTLPDQDRSRFETHLQDCAGCRHYVQQMHKTIHLTGKLTEESIPPPARDELLNAFRDWKKG